jgi:hypothetical protein
MTGAGATLRPISVEGVFADEILPNTIMSVAPKRAPMAMKKGADTKKQRTRRTGLVTLNFKSKKQAKAGRDAPLVSASA